MAQDEQKNTSPEKTIWLDIPPEAAKQVVGGFEIIATIGQGGMGTVFKARQPLLNRVVALKVMAPGLSSKPDFVKRFIHEAASAASLAHPNMVLVYSAGEDAGRYFIAMEFVEGESVRERLVRDGVIKPKDAVAITLNVATALNYAWQKSSLIHRDVKPDNIFLSRTGEVKVGDLGLAKSLGGEATMMTGTGLMMGTPSYISPEQALAEKNVDFRTDIYSLGCTLYHMLTGRTPYAAESGMAMAIKHVNEPPPSLTKLLPNCPPALAKVVARMMAKKPEARYQSYQELIAELNAMYVGLPKEGRMMASYTAPAKDSDGVKYAAIAAILLLCGLFWWAPWKHAVKPSTGQRPSESLAAAPALAPMTRSFKVSYIKEKSMSLFPIGYKHTIQYYSEQTTDDPNAVFKGIPVNFDQHTGKEIYYQVESTTPIVKVVFMGEGIDGSLDALDMNGKLLVSTVMKGGQKSDNSEKMNELILPGVTNFVINIINNAPNWFLIQSIRLEDANGIVPSVFKKPAAASSLAGKNAGSQFISTGITPALVQVTTATKSNTNSSYIVTLPAKPANGNTLIAVSLYHTGRSDYPSVDSISQTGANWIPVIYTNGCGSLDHGSFVTEIWYAANILNAGTNITLNLIGNNIGAGVVVMEYSGLLTVNPADGAAANGSAIVGTTADTGTTPMTTQPTELWLAAVGLNILDSRLNPATDGFTIVTNVLGQKIGGWTKTPEYRATFNLNILQKIVNTTGTANFRGAFSPPSIWNGVVATFKAAQTAAPPIAPATRSFKVSFIKEKSMAQFPTGYKLASLYSSKQTTDDPNAVFRGIPVYFNQGSGTEVDYQLESTTPIMKVTYMGQGFEDFEMNALDLDGNVLASTGIIDWSEREKIKNTRFYEWYKLSLPGPTRFKLVIKNHGLDWVLIQSIRLEDANGIVPPDFTNGNPTAK